MLKTLSKENNPNIEVRQYSILREMFYPTDFAVKNYVLHFV